MTEEHDDPLQEPVPRFHELLREAYLSSEEADLFDVDSSDPTSEATWRTLLEQSRQDVVALVRHIIANQDKLLDYH